MKKKKITFKKVYLIYVIILLVASVAAVLYVSLVLRQYEELLPEKKVQAAMSQLTQDAGTDAFFAKYGIPVMQGSKYEEQSALQERYLAQYKKESLEIVAKSSQAEDELLYHLENSGVPVAEVKLKAASPVKTKLTVLNFREWELEYIKPIVKPVDYTLTVPKDFVVSINDVLLTEDEQTDSMGNQVTYTIEQLYLVPEVAIWDKAGNPVSFGIRNGKILAEYYDYSLTLPSALLVEVDGVLLDGEKLTGNRIAYNINTLKKPVVRLLDDYGNELIYDGGNEIPLTVLSLKADSRYSVTVEGKEVPQKAISKTKNPEYELLDNYAGELPSIMNYDIAVLKKDAVVSVTDENGNAVTFDKNSQSLDLAGAASVFDEVPGDVAGEVDVLDMAQNWSLFMSADLKLSEISSALIKDSYQYKVAVQYANSEDIKFTSEHVLLDPAFTENKVERFAWITDNCFSVDISFVKHMRLRTGKIVDDPMNDRFYFVKYDDTDDGKDNPVWKIAGMKEIVNND